MTATCETCRHWRPHAWLTNPHRGVCAAHPTPVEHSDDYGCGEHQPRAEEAPAGRSVDAWVIRRGEEYIASQPGLTWTPFGIRQALFYSAKGDAPIQNFPSARRVRVTITEHDEEPQP